MLTSTRYGISYPNPATRADSADVPRDIKALVDAVELTVMFGGQGLLSARPTSTSGSPGKQGRLYYATDNQHVYYDTGTSWIDITPSATIADGSVTLAKLASASVDSSKIVDGSITGADIADGTISAAEIAATLFPSQGAGNGTEALRAIGTGAGQVMAGNSFANTPDVCTFLAGGPSTVGGTTYQVQAPAAGTYILAFGAGRWESPSQGNAAYITSNKTGTVQSRFSDVGGSGGPVHYPGLVLALNEVVTLTLNGPGYWENCWARLTRTA